MKAAGTELNFKEQQLTVHMDKVIGKNMAVPNKDISYLEGEDKIQIENLLNKFKELFSDIPGFTHVAHHKIDIGNNGPLRYETV